MEPINYGPLRFLIGSWHSEGFQGKNRAPDTSRNVENTKFRQEMDFEPIGDVNNHEQKLFVLRYNTKAWEQGDDENPFHEETGYFIWDKANRQILKSFIVPRGVAVNAGGDADINSTEFTLKAQRGSTTYGICSNQFLDDEFQVLSYQVSFNFESESKFSYDENTKLKIKGQDKVFDHTEKNILLKK
ncbi:MAG: heme-binding beta-barrel domain-containing protein [Bacteriovoracaceae bacterium]|jgi:hypothetical protein|nr:heme-binding beta-barrel domain-containing protein [Bacteriovoracaceae bacterium]